ncbi:MAG: hypothetical protein PVJ98_02335 [Akkermansiaceae bacterium]|jgi:hypothetical protein
MICLAGNLPALKVGRQKVVGYHTDWIDQSLARAADAGGRKDCPFLKDISNGVVHYLQNQSSLKLLPIEALYERIRRMLLKLGFPEIAHHLSPLAPPVTVSLVGPAIEAGPGAKEVFFKILREEIQLLQQSGAESVRFRDFERSLLLLAQPDLSTTDLLRHEIKAFLNGRHPRVSFPGRHLHLTLEP